MPNPSNPIILLDCYNINHYDFRTMINRRCNNNVAKFAAISNILKNQFSDLEISNDMLISYKLAKKIPQAALSLIMSTPAFKPGQYSRHYSNHNSTFEGIMVTVLLIFLEHQSEFNHTN